MALIFLVTFILLHSLIHLMGFVKSFNLAGVKAPASKVRLGVSKSNEGARGLLWLGSGITFFIAAMAALVQRPWWWMFAAGAIILSQALIIVYWREAKFGTIANLLILPVVIVSCATWCFNRMVEREVKDIMREAIVNDTKIVDTAMTAGLPFCVQKWLSRSGVIGKTAVHTVYLKQKGAMCTEPSGTWLPTEAEQYFTIDKPAFVWHARVQMMPLVTLSGRDKFEHAKGNMLIKALGLLPVANAKGPETDQGTMLRFLGEMCWFPSAALSNYITWEELGTTEAKATMSYKGLSVTGNYKFSAEGDFLSFSAKRYMDNRGEVSLEDWFVPATEWKEMDGLRIPVKGLVTWKLRSGDFDYYKWEITEIAYNKRM